MNYAFRELLKKVGSGSHTSKDLTRQEAADATRMMLQQEATPAQIGAFMIAHRIKRPTPIELAGMLDGYDQLGPQLDPIQSVYPVTVLCSPYDGRSRTAPLSPLTALILAAAQAPAVLHGGDRMPTKMGLPLVEVWGALGVNWRLLSLAQVQQILGQTGVGFVYQPHHFPMAQALVPYRDEIGKRPTLATVELMWSPYRGAAHVASGYVHPPTEERTQIAYQLRGTAFYSTIKGLEGSCDLPRSRTAIIGLGHLQAGEPHFERLLLHPRDYDLAGDDPALGALSLFTQEMMAVLEGQHTELARSAIWNGGFYLWRCGVTPTLETGFEKAQALLASGTVGEKLDELVSEIATLQSRQSDTSTGVSSSPVVMHSA
jgi:anthranilate phosphoribosyltransferase